MQSRYSESDLAAAKLAFDLAVKSVGSKGKLARALGISKSAVMQWDTVPLGRAADVSRLSGVRADLLCPGFIPAPVPVAVPDLVLAPPVSR